MRALVSVGRYVCLRRAEVSIECLSVPILYIIFFMIYLFIYLLLHITFRAGRQHQSPGTGATGGYDLPDVGAWD